MFNPELIGATLVTGVLRKSKDPSKCMLVLSSDNNGDIMLEVNIEDVVKHEIQKEDEKNGNKTIILYLKENSSVKKIHEGRIESIEFTSGFNPIRSNISDELFVFTPANCIKKYTKELEDIDESERLVLDLIELAKIRDSSMTNSEVLRLQSMLDAIRARRPIAREAFDNCLKITGKFLPGFTKFV